MYGLNTKAQGKMYAGTFIIPLDIFGILTKYLDPEMVLETEEVLYL